MQEKTCPSCEIPKPSTAFARRKTQRPGHLVAHCKACVAEKNRQRRKADPKRASEICRNSKLKAAFGISPEDYDLMFAKQNGKCAICKATEADVWHKNLSVDHCHGTGRIRGLLCTSCNTGLGRFKDNPDLLQTAISYLKEGI